MILILVSGTRHATSANTVAIQHALEFARDLYPTDAVILRHGAAEGVDTIAATLAAGWGWGTDPWHANWARYGPSAGPRRNRDTCQAEPRPTIVVALPGIGLANKGTYNLVNEAVKAGLRIIVQPIEVPR